ncbi:TrbI/VirB10 family protein [Caulobacter endophyticus]|uniref:Conjugal transfer protein TrbI n=1 Tax=Caulobacter endophyticus TaxID=2172652 RepID=A0A2T9JI57_9CAUL|nr:TrbI/VirB10 family protein [Caulobacter endophyticus]PVM83362.1 conjugal transfer protein TrbI [Caulobacter endophyticus]
MSGDRTEAEEAIAKTLRLRATPAPVARISRRALAVSGAVVAAGLFGALAWSLNERDRPKPPPGDTPSAAVPSERVTALPRGYAGPAGVPTLGPPLPGDLGRPILRAQRNGQVAAGEGFVDEASQPPPTAIGMPAPPVDPERDAAILARRAARQSGLFVAAAMARSGSDRSISAQPAVAEAGVGPDIGSGAGPDPRTTSAERLQAPASPYILQAGSIIAAALVTGLRSDTPGVAIAQVTQDVHDSLGGGVLLIPAGARLVGEYDAQVKSGQSRLPVTWTRLILPSGRSIVLDKLPAADAQGMAGLQDGVDRHGGRVLAAAGLSTLLALGAEAGGGQDEDDLVRALRRAGSTSASQVGQQIVGKSLDLLPTLTIRPGAPLRVLLTRDLVLEPYRERTAP